MHVLGLLLVMSEKLRYPLSLANDGVSCFRQKGCCDLRSKILYFLSAFGGVQEHIAITEYNKHGHRKPG